MFELGFMEILVIVIVAFVVVGPEKLPKALAKIYKWLKKISNYIFEFKAKIDRELEISELREEATRYKNELMSAHQKLDEMAKKEILAPFKNEVENINKIDKDMKSEIKADFKNSVNPNHSANNIVTLKKDKNRSSAKSELEELMNKGQKTDG